MKLRLLLSSVTLIVLLCAFHIDSWRRNEAYELQKLDSQRQAEELAAVERAKHQRLIAEEDLWLGDLELEISNQLEVHQHKPQIAATPQLYKRICGWLPSSSSNAKAQYDMHECHAGSPICTSGGTISIESHNRLISTISLNLLQPDANGKLRSKFHVKWWDTTLTVREKIELLQELAGPADSSDPTTLRGLLRSAYRDGTSETSQVEASPKAPHGGLLRFILLGIVKAVVTQSA